MYAKNHKRSQTKQSFMQATEKLVLSHILSDLYISAKFYAEHDACTAVTWEE
jgi:hypothetical protein